MAVLEMKGGGGGGGGLLVQKFLRYRVYGSYGISVVNTNMLISKKLGKQSWHCSINPGSNMCASCYPRNISWSNLFLWLL